MWFQTFETHFWVHCLWVEAREQKIQALWRGRWDWQLLRRALEAASLPGRAFPSSHVFTLPVCAKNGMEIMGDLKRDCMSFKITLKGCLSASDLAQPIVFGPFLGKYSMTNKLSKFSWPKALPDLLPQGSLREGLGELISTSTDSTNENDTYQHHLQRQEGDTR